MQLLPSVFEGSTPEEVLFKACDVHGPEVRLSEPERVRVGGMMGFFAKSIYRVRVQTPKVSAMTEPLRDMLEETPAVSVDLRTPVGAPRPKTFDEALAHVTGSLGPAPGTAGSVADPEWQALVKRLRGESLAEIKTDPPVAKPAPVAVEPELEPEPTPVGVEPEPFVTKTFAPQPPPATPKATDSPTAVPAALISAGLSTELLAEALGRFGAASTFEEILSSLPPPRPLPQTPGSLIAVIGTRDRVLNRAKTIARDVGVRPQEVACADATRSLGTSRTGKESDEIAAKAPVGRPKAASVKTAVARTNSTKARPVPTRSRAASLGLIVHNPTEAVDLSPGWRRDRIAVVAVFLDDQSGRIDLPSVRALLRALRPSMTLAIVDATSKSEDVANLAKNIGGIDALMVEKSQLTVTPLAILGSQIPVARLDNGPATPRSWAALVRNVIGHDSPRRRS